MPTRSTTRHYNDVTWPSWHLNSPATPMFVQLFIQTYIKENIKATRNCCEGNPLVAGSFPSQRVTKGQQRGKGFYVMTSLCSDHNTNVGTINELYSDPSTSISISELWYILYKGTVIRRCVSGIHNWKYRWIFVAFILSFIILVIFACIPTTTGVDTHFSLTYVIHEIVSLNIIVPI